MTKPTPQWLTYEQCGQRTLHLRDSHYGLVLPAEPSAHEKLLADPLSMYAELLALADWYFSPGPVPTTTLPARSQVEVYGPTDSIPFRCLPPFVLKKYHELHGDDWLPVDWIWVDGGKIRVPQWRHDLSVSSLFTNNFFYAQELIAETTCLLPPEQLDAYGVWCGRYVAVSRRPNAEIRGDCAALLELIDIDDETAAVQAELMEYPIEPGQWEAAIALHRKYLAWCKAIVNDGWDLFALNSSDFVGNEELL